MKKLLTILLVLIAAQGFSQDVPLYGKDTTTGMPFKIYTIRPQYVQHPIYSKNDSTIAFDSARYYISSYAKNATGDSTILTLLDGTRFAAKDSIGAGGSATAATVTQLNTGTDNSAFATSLGLQGSKYLSQTDAKVYAATSGSLNTYTASLTPAITSLTTGLRVIISFSAGNTGAATLNLNSLGAKAITKEGTTALGSGDIKAGQIIALTYDGTEFQITGSAALASDLARLGGFQTFTQQNTFSAGIVCSNFFRQAIAGDQGNFFLPSANTLTLLTATQLLENGDSVFLRAAFPGYNATSVTAGKDFANTVFGKSQSTPASSPLGSNVEILTPVKSGAGTIGNFQCLYVADAPTGGTVNSSANLGYTILRAPIKLKSYTVATLPTGNTGDEAYVTDATSPTYLGTLTGGGSVVCPVFYNGSAWVSH